MDVGSIDSAVQPTARPAQPAAGGGFAALLNAVSTAIDAGAQGNDAPVTPVKDAGGVPDPMAPADEADAVAVGEAKPKSAKSGAPVDASPYAQEGLEDDAGGEGDLAAMNGDTTIVQPLPQGVPATPPTAPVATTIPVGEIPATDAALIAAPSDMAMTPAPAAPAPGEFQVAAATAPMPQMQATPTPTAATSAAPAPAVETDAAAPKSAAPLDFGTAMAAADGETPLAPPAQPLVQEKPTRTAKAPPPALTAALDSALGLGEVGDDGIDLENELGPIAVGRTPKVAGAAGPNLNSAPGAAPAANLAANPLAAPLDASKPKIDATAWIPSAGEATAETVGLDAVAGVESAGSIATDTMAASFAGPVTDAGSRPAPAATSAQPAQSFRAALSSPPAEQIALQIKNASVDGIDRISIKLVPATLGRIQVNMEFSQDGRVAAHITADRRDTLELLQRDSRQLERAFQDAGLRLDSNSLSFNLRDGGRQSASTFGQAESGAFFGPGGEETETPLPPTPVPPRTLAAGRVDISV